MSMSTNLHQIREMKAESVDSSSWLTIRDNHNNKVTIFIPYETAKAITDVWDNEKVVAK